MTRKSCAVGMRNAILRNHLKSSDIPVQFTPSPVYPVLQLQRNDPGTLAHIAFGEQLWSPVTHSSISAKSKKHNWINHLSPAGLHQITAVMTRVVPAKRFNAFKLSAVQRKLPVYKAGSAYYQFYFYREAAWPSDLGRWI